MNCKHCEIGYCKECSERFFPKPSQDIIGIATRIAGFEKMYGTPMKDMPNLNVAVADLVGIAQALLIAVDALENIDIACDCHGPVASQALSRILPTE